MRRVLLFILIIFFVVPAMLWPEEFRDIRNLVPLFLAVVASVAVVSSALEERLEALETKLEVLFEPADEEERNIWKESLELKFERRRYEKWYWEEFRIPDWKRRLPPWRWNHEKALTLFSERKAIIRRDLERNVGRAKSKKAES